MLAARKRIPIWANVEEEWMRRSSGTVLDLEEDGVHQICSLMWADNFWIMSHSKENLEQMQRELTEEADKWDLVPKPASLWWTSTYDSEEKVDMNLGTTSGCYSFTFEDKFKISLCAMGGQLKNVRCGGRTNAVGLFF